MKYDPYNSKVYKTKEEYIQDCYGGLPNEYALEMEYNKLPDVAIGYDSTPDTLRHIKRVAELLTQFASELIRRANIHDSSKLQEPEKPEFDRLTPKLAGSTYGSEEYKSLLGELAVALKHHYEHNSHHPEHYENGVNGMDLFDLVEMLLDWKAAGERHHNGSIHKSIEINTSRFALSEQVVQIFTNTAKSLQW